MDFIKQLNAEIADQAKIYKNANLFIARHNLKEIQLRKNFLEADLPNSVYLGTIYIIKNNSIIEFYNSISNEDRHMFIEPKFEPYYRSIVTMHNINKADISLADVEKIINTDSLTSHDVDKTIGFLMALLRTGFKLYVREL